MTTVAFHYSNDSVDMSNVYISAVAMTNAVATLQLLLQQLSSSSFLREKNIGTKKVAFA